MIKKGWVGEAGISNDGIKRVEQELNVVQKGKGGKKCVEAPGLIVEPGRVREETKVDLRKTLSPLLLLLLQEGSPTL